MKDTTIGFIGLGAMGWHMAWNLAASGKYRFLCIWNRTHGKCLQFKKEFEDKGGKQSDSKPHTTSIVIASTLEELWRHCQGGAIASMLMDDKATEHVFQELRSVSEHFTQEEEDGHDHGDSTLLLNCATVSPDCVLRLSDLLDGRIQLVNCAVTGRPEHAEKAELCSWLSGGEETSVAQCENNIAATWSKAVRVISTTDATASSRFKLATNFLIYGIGHLVGEGLVLFDAFKLPREKILDWTNCLMPGTLLHTYSKILVQRDFDRNVGASIEVGLKDLSYMKNILDDFLSTREDSTVNMTVSDAADVNMVVSNSCSGAGQQSPTSLKRKAETNSGQSSLKIRRGHSSHSRSNMCILDTMYKNMIAQKEESGEQTREWASMLERIEKSVL